MDLELSFITIEEILRLMEELLTDTLSKTTPHLKMTAAPFPRLPYKEAMEKVCSMSQNNAHNYKYLLAYTFSVSNSNQLVNKVVNTNQAEINEPRKTVFVLFSS